jgi:hypothetical protein
MRDSEKGEDFTFSHSIFHAGSSTGTFWPTRKGKNLNKHQFSWELPPIVFRDAKVNGTGWGQLTLSIHLKGKCSIDSFKYASVKYFLDVKIDRHKAISAGTIPSNKSWTRSGRKPVVTLK